MLPGLTKEKNSGGPDTWRREEEQRGRRRRGRFGILYKVLSFFLILAAIVTGCIVFFRVNEIVVVGETRYSETEIIAATGVELGENLFQLNKFDMAHKVLTQLPYVDEITISRKLPDTLVLKVTESTPLAVLESGGNWWLLDVRGKLLEQGDAALAQGRAVLTGLDPLSPAVGGRLAVGEEQQKKLESLMALFSALPGQGNDGTGDRVYRPDHGECGAVWLRGDPYGRDAPLWQLRSQTWRLQRALEELSTQNGTVSGTLHLPSEGNKAWLLAKRWMPGDEMESSPPEKGRMRSLPRRRPKSACSQQIGKKEENMPKRRKRGEFAVVAAFAVLGFLLAVQLKSVKLNTALDAAAPAVWRPFRSSITI